MAELRFKKDHERKLLGRLAPIPVGSGLEPVCGGIRVSDYESLLPDSAIVRKLHCGYISALFPLLIGVLTHVPENERLELIFEQQDVYSGITDLVLDAVSNSSLPMCRTIDGRSKLAKWGYVPKGSTLLTDPADFFAFSLLQYYRDPNSLKSQWCRPLLDSVDSVKHIGHIYSPDEAKREVQFMLEKLKSDSRMAEGFDRINVVIAEAEINAKKNK